ncbi:MAG TPA: glycosyltransferase [Desulfomonilia bacterium]
MSNSSDHVTICIPAHNAGWSIERTLESILVQDYPDIDVFVCDNASTDNTAEIAKKYESRGVKYYFNPVISGGAEGNWNYALTLCDGPLVALYHADDIYTQTMVRKQVEFLKTHPDVSAVFTMMQTIDELDRPIRMGKRLLPSELKGITFLNFDEFFNAVLKYCTFTPVPTMMTRKNVLNEVGNFNWHIYHSASDIDLYLRMAKKWGPIGIIDEPLHQYRISSTQGTEIIAKGRTVLADYFRVIDSHLNDEEERKIAKPKSISFYEMYKSIDLLTCAFNLIEQDKTDEALKLMKKALTVQNFNTAIKRPMYFIKLLIGLSLFITASLGAGHLTVKMINRILSLRKSWLRKPI